jgi:heterodisulfide reductase subunit A
LKIGVYVCHCGTNISGVVDVVKVAQYAAALPNVAVSRDYKYMCSEPGQNLIQEDIRQLGLDAVVVAACSPTMHEPTFQTAVARAGLNPYMFQMASVREHVSWVTPDPAEATEKAERLIEAAVFRAAQQEPLEKRRIPVKQAVLIVGGGIAGIEAALKCAEAGKKVYLVEKEPSIGGHMAMFDKTFPTLDCSQCILTPKMVEVLRNENIELLDYSYVKEISGHVGDFRASVVRKARYVDISKCTGCAICSTKCPGKAPDEFNLGMTKRKAIYIPFPQAVPLKAVIDRGSCLYFQKNICKVCAKFCSAGAIEFGQKDEEVELEVGAVILATGFKPFDARRVPEYGYGKFPNVFTSLEFERMTSSSGPTAGKLVMRDGREPESVAIVHCVGSRNVNHNVYCSKICCMQSLKHAHLLKEHLPGVAVYDFFIDMRAAGKGYEEFYKRVMGEGTIMIRGRPAYITDVPSKPEEKGKLVLVAEDTVTSTVMRYPVDMVILSVGLEASDDAKELARTFTCSRTADGFFLEKHPKLAPVSTPTAGVFIAGASQGPKDIPESVAQAGAAAAEALALMGKGYFELEPYVARMDEELCSGCGVCLELCPYGALSRDPETKLAKVEAALCQGCGACVAACPSNALDLDGYKTGQVVAELEGILA